MRSRYSVLSLVALLFAANLANAQTTFKRGWIDINFGGGMAAEDVVETTYSTIRSGEIATFDSTYNTKHGPEFDFGGGVLISPMFGVGVRIAGVAGKKPANLSIVIPHPYLYNRYATDTADTEGDLEHAEGSVNIMGVLNVPTNNDMRVQLFGGPTYFRVTGDGITDIRYEQAYFLAANAVDITTYDTTEVEGTGWGFNVGADISYFFSRYAGVGGTFMLNRATVKIEDEQVLSDEPVDVKAGGFSYGGGIRFRF